MFLKSPAIHFSIKTKTYEHSNKFKKVFSDADPMKQNRSAEVPLRLVMYPGEAHGYRGAAHRYDYNLRMFRWFDPAFSHTILVDFPFF